MNISRNSIVIAQKVVEEIEGRAADIGLSLPFLISMVECAPDGNHIDIGSLFGASAIAVALIKKELGHKGKIYCIDPYDNETRIRQTISIPEIPEDLLCGNPITLMKNAEKFGVELILIEKESHPWPKELENVTFATAYIDGDHDSDAPWNDFENLRGRVTDYIGTDNYEEEYPDVVNAMWKAMDTDDWFLYYKNLGFVALRRIMPARSDPTAPFQVLAL